MQEKEGGPCGCGGDVLLVVLLQVCTSFALFDVWMGRVRAAGSGRDGGLQGQVGEGFGRVW